MRTLLAAVAPPSPAFAPALPAQAQGGRHAGGRDVLQFDPDAAGALHAEQSQRRVVQGTLYIRRPGRMRFEYDAPSKLKIVADGSQVTMWDPTTRDFGQWPIGWTAASFLVKEPLSLVGRHHGREDQRVNGCSRP